MTREQMIAEARRLRGDPGAMSTDTRCWHHPALWGLLPEKTDSLPTVPTWPEFGAACTASVGRQLLRPRPRLLSAVTAAERQANRGSSRGDR